MVINLMNEKVAGSSTDKASHDDSDDNANDSGDKASDTDDQGNDDIVINYWNIKTTSCLSLEATTTTLTSCIGRSATKLRRRSTLGGAM